MDKNRFETQKHIVNLDPKVHDIQSFFTVDDLKWLIAQAEKVTWLEHLREGLKYNLKTCKEDVCEMEKEIAEHCETKGLLGRQVFALSTLVDKQYEEIENLKVEIKKFQQP